MEELKLFEHQKKSVEFYKTNRYCLNLSCPGTGKTFPAIITCLGKRATVVCPAFLVRNWQREFARFGVQAAVYPEVSATTIISQDLVYKCASVFHNLDVLVVDECHGFCNIESRRSKALHTYVKEFKPKQLILMSGTPMRNRIPELYSLLMLVDYGRGGGFKQSFPNQFIFNHMFTHPVTKYFGKRKVTSFEGSKNIAKLKEWLQPIYIKFRIEDLHDFPEVWYEEFISDKPPEDILWLDSELEEGWEQMEQFNAPPPAHISTAKLESAESKVETTIEYCKTLLDGGVESLVVFSDHVNPAKNICEGLKDYGSRLITGATPMPERDRAVVEFQAGTLRVIVGTIGAMGTGLTLTKSSTCVRNDLSWIPANNAQAVGRLRRISQKNKVRVIDVVREGVDKKISKKLKEKEKVINEVFNG